MTESSSPSIAILGAGAIGCMAAAALFEGGYSPSLIARTGFDSLSFTLSGQQTNYPVTVLTGPAESQRGEGGSEGESVDQSVDVLLLCTKSYQVPEIAPWFPVLVNDQTTVAVLQNGVDHVERLSAYVDGEQVVPGVVQIAAERHAPGVVEQIRPGIILVPESSRGERFAALFADSAGIDVVVEPDFVSSLWRKLTMNATTGGVCTLTLRQNEVFGEPAIRTLATELMQEVMAVGRAEGATFPENFIENALDMLAGPVANHWTSMAVDRRSGQPLEWDIRNAIVGKLGRQHGIPTPLNDAITTLLAASR